MTAARGTRANREANELQKLQKNYQVDRTPYSAAPKVILIFIDKNFIMK